MEKDPTIWEKLKIKVIRSEEFNMKKTRRYNILVFVNFHQDLEKMLLSVFRSPMDV